MQKKATTTLSRPTPGTSTPTIPIVNNNGPLKEIALLTTNHNDYDLDYIPRAIYNNQVDELLLREEGMSGRIQKHARSKNRSASPAPPPPGSPRFNAYMLSQSSTPNISRPHSRKASANPELATPSEPDISESFRSDPDLAATETRLVVLTELGINIITPIYLATIPPLPKANIQSPQDTPIHSFGTHKALPPTFPRTVRASTWKNTLAVSTEQVIFDARRTCAAMVAKQEHAKSGCPTIKRSGLSFRGRGLSEDRAKQGLVEGMGTRAPTEKVYAKPNETVLDLETNYQARQSVIAGSRRESRRSKGNSVGPVVTADFKSPMFSKFPVSEVTEPLSMEELNEGITIIGSSGAASGGGFYSAGCQKADSAISPPPLAFLNEEADAWATSLPPSSLDTIPFVQADKKQQDLSARNCQGSINNKTSPTDSEDWLINERKKMNAHWGRAGAQSSSNSGSIEQVSNKSPVSGSVDLVKPATAAKMTNLESSTDSTAVGNSSTKMVDSFLKQFEVKTVSAQQQQTDTANATEQDPILNSFNKMVNRSIDVLTNSEGSSPKAEVKLPATSTTSSVPYPGIDGLEEPNWGDVVSPISAIGIQVAKTKSVQRSQHSLNLQVNFSTKSLSGSQESLNSRVEPIQPHALAKSLGESVLEKTSEKIASMPTSLIASRTSISINGKVELEDQNAQPVHVESLSSLKDDAAAVWGTIEPTTTKTMAPKLSPSTDALNSPEPVVSPPLKESSGLKSTPQSAKQSIEHLKDEQDTYHEKKHGGDLKSFTSGFKSMVGKMKNSSNHSLTPSEVLKSSTPQEPSTSPRTSRSKKKCETPSSSSHAETRSQTSDDVRTPAHEVIAVSMKAPEQIASKTETKEGCSVVSGSADHKKESMPPNAPAQSSKPGSKKTSTEEITSAKSSKFAEKPLQPTENSIDEKTKEGQISTKTEAVAHVTESKVFPTTSESAEKETIVEIKPTPIPIESLPTSVAARSPKKPLAANDEEEDFIPVRVVSKTAAKPTETAKSTTDDISISTFKATSVSPAPAMKEEIDPVKVLAKTASNKSSIEEISKSKSEVKLSTKVVDKAASANFSIEQIAKPAVATKVVTEKATSNKSSIDAISKQKPEIKPTAAETAVIAKLASAKSSTEEITAKPAPQTVNSTSPENTIEPAAEPKETVTQTPSAKTSRDYLFQALSATKPVKADAAVTASSLQQIPASPSQSTKPVSPRVSTNIGKLSSAFESAKAASPRTSQSKNTSPIQSKENVVANSVASQLAIAPIVSSKPVQVEPTPQKVKGAVATTQIPEATAPSATNAVTTAPKTNKSKYMNAMDLMKQQQSTPQQQPTKTPTPTPTPAIFAAMQTPATAIATSQIVDEPAKDLWQKQPNAFSSRSNSVLALTVGSGPAEKEKLRVQESAAKMKESAGSVTRSVSSVHATGASTASVLETKKKEEVSGGKMPSAEDMRGKAVCEKLKCEIKVESFELSCIDEKKREVFPTLELRRIVKAEFTPGRPEVTLHACCPRDKGKSGSKFRTIDIVFEGGPGKAKSFAEGLMVMVYGAIVPEKAVFRKVLCLVDRFDKEPGKMIEKYMKPVWAVFNKPMEIKNVQFMEMSVNNAISEEEWHNVSNVVVTSSEFAGKMLQLLVKNGYADEPVDLPVDEDPVDAALIILKCE
ncbi:UNVERIFIED_CONTAM: hypothetical protein HDU68_002270 [Siphonaria sp. JEL0065]|nr:hypothetical protein HDU68_002270 [Siphonaria sp. JEL0065]